MTTPVLHYHPFSSYCIKVLITIEVLGALVERRLLNLGEQRGFSCLADLRTYLRTHLLYAVSPCDEMSRPSRSSSSVTRSPTTRSTIL